jgi:DNA-binding transcriptional LysR family regulator
LILLNVFKVERFEVDIKQLKYFACVAEELHFGKAAEKSHITQPALSIQIKNLEEYLGGKLFVRNKRNVALTDAGKDILSKSYKIINAMDELLEYSAALFNGTAGHINISYSGLAAYTGVMGSVIETFRQMYPDINVGLEEHDPYEQLQMVQNGDIHIAFMTTMKKDIPAGLRSLHLASSPLTFLLPKNHNLSSKGIENYQQLEHEAFVIDASPDDTQATSVIESVCGFKPIISHRASSALLLPSLVSAGLGIAIIPKAFEKIAYQTDSVSLPLLEPQNMDISLIFLDNEKSEIVNRFKEIVKTLSLIPVSAN